jgi:hypothetical protein
MSHKYNDEWIEGAYEAFGCALMEKDVSLAKDIIADTFDAGFDREARAMSKAMRQVEFNRETLPNYA